jgi:Undecaprenyl-phosphate galactose phosphotransferase WbaP
MATTFSPLPFAHARQEQPGRCGLVMLCGDLAAVTVSILLATGIRAALGPGTDLAPPWQTLPVVGLFTTVYALFGLYPGVAMNAVTEMRKLVSATTLVFVLLATGLFLLKEGNTYSRLVFVLAWVLALVLVPVTRTLARALFAKESWWGIPVAVFGATDDAQDIAHGLNRRPQAGLSPTFTCSDRRLTRRSLPGDSPYETAPEFSRRLGLQHAILAAPHLPGNNFSSLLETGGDAFSTFYVMTGLDGYSSESVEARQIGNTVTLQIRRNLLSPGCQFAKGLIDRTLSGVLLIVLAPVLALIALAIRLESRGAALFHHKRIGRNGRDFHVWKFRSMRADGDAVLAKYFLANPDEREVWLAERKLRKDPRLTRLGRLLRKTSLDELPQLWNVLRGDMSLVGPRPIIRDEIPKYGKQFDLYCRVMPGLTGLWQVSGRSETSYDERVDLDAYYVRNWSPWFDVYLLFATVRVVLKCEGAY